MVQFTCDAHTLKNVWLCSFTSLNPKHSGFICGLIWYSVFIWPLNKIGTMFSSVAYLNVRPDFLIQSAVISDWQQQNTIELYFWGRNLHVHFVVYRQLALPSDNPSLFSLCFFCQTLRISFNCLPILIKIAKQNWKFSTHKRFQSTQCTNLLTKIVNRDGVFILEMFKRSEKVLL